MSATAEGPSPTNSGENEPVISRLQRALCGRAMTIDAFAGSVREAVGAEGGAVLFQFDMDDTKQSPHCVAAVVIGEEDAQEIAIIDLSGEGGEPRVTAASDSDLPAAKIAAAYAGLARSWVVAA